MRYLILVALLGLALAGCADQGPYVPPQAFPWAPPEAQIDSLWRATEACSGLSGNWRTLDFYIVPASELDTPTGKALGMWDGHDGIYLAEPNFPTWMPWPRTIQHEMLHALARSVEHGAAFDACGLR